MDFNSIKELNLQIPNFAKDLDLLKFKAMMEKIELFYNGLAKHVEDVVKEGDAFPELETITGDEFILVKTETGIKKIKLSDFKTYLLTE